MTRLVVSAAVAAVAVALVPGRAFAGPKPTHSIDQICAGMTTLDVMFNPAKHSFLVHYREETTVFDNAGKEQPEFGRWKDVQFARMQKMLYSHVKTKMAQQERVEEEWVAWKDGVGTQRKADGVSVLPYIVPQVYSNTTYATNLSLFIERELEWTSPSEGRDVPYATCLADTYFWTLPRLVVENKTKYSLRPEQELIDGALCHVIEWPGHDTVWVDTRCGFIARKRVFSFDGQSPVAELRNLDLKEVRPNLWLPQEQERRRFHQSAGGKGPAADKAGVKLLDKIRLVTVEFDKLTPEFFAVPMSEDQEIMISDGIRKMEYLRHPAGTDPVAQAYADATARQPRRPRRFWYLMNALVLGTLAAGAMTWWLTRFKSAPATEPAVSRPNSLPAPQDDTPTAR